MSDLEAAYSVKPKVKVELSESPTASQGSAASCTTRIKLPTRIKFPAQDIYSKEIVAK